MAELHETYVRWLELENQALIDACRQDIAALIPTCPGWTVLDLVSHHATFQRWITEIITARQLEPRAPAPSSPPDGADPIDWYRSIGRDLIHVLRITDPDTNVWGVTNQQTVGAWARRQASETAVHRWDAQNAVGRVTPIEHADDYILEMFDHLLPHLIAHFGALAPTGTIRLTSAIEQRSWTADSTADDRIITTGTDTTADVTLSGTASDLFLALWSRPNAAHITGDETVLEQWSRAITGS